MQTYRVNLVVTGGLRLPAFSVTAIGHQNAIAKVNDIIDGLGGFGRVESGYIIGRDGERRSIC